MNNIRYCIALFILTLSSFVGYANSEPNAGCNFDMTIVEPCSNGSFVAEYCFRNGSYCSSEGDFWTAQGEFGATGEILDAQGNSLGGVVEGPLSSCVRVRWTIAPGSTMPSGGLSFESGLGSGASFACCQEAERADAFTECLEPPCSITFELSTDNTIVCFSNDCGTPVCVTFNVIFTSGLPALNQIIAVDDKACAFWLRKGAYRTISSIVILSVVEGNCAERPSGERGELQVFNDTDGELSVAPNPVTAQQFTLDIPTDFTLETPTTLSIVDLLGRILLEQNITEYITTVSTANIPNGHYWVVVQDQQGQRKYEKIVLNNL